MLLRACYLLSCLLPFVLLAYLIVRYYHNKKTQGQVAKEDSLLAIEVDIDTSPLFQLSKERSQAQPYYLVIDTEAVDLVDNDIFEASLLSKEAETLSHKLYPPIVVLSYQVLDEEKNLIRELSHIIYHQTEMSEEVRKINLLRNEDLLQGEELVEVLETFINEVARAKVLVAHNLNFHLNSIFLACQSVGLELDFTEGKEKICTMEQGQALGFKRNRQGQALYPKLSELFRYLYFRKFAMTLKYQNKSLRDVRLVSSCLRKLKIN